MARVTIEDCLERVPNRFALVHMTSQRVRQLRDGAEPMVESKNKEIVQALREIASGDVFPISKQEAEESRARAEAMERARLAQASIAAAQQGDSEASAPDSAKEDDEAGA